MYGSPLFIAFLLGQYFRVNGLPLPRNAKIVRGNLVNADGVIYEWVEYGGGARYYYERRENLSKAAVRGDGKYKRGGNV